MAGQGRIARAVLLLCALLTGLVATAARAQPQEDHSYYGPRLIEEKVRIPAPGGYTIAATILRPDAAGPFGVVVLNALGFHRKRVAEGRPPAHPLTNRYAVIAGAMLAGAGGIGVWDLTVGWDHAVLWIEGTLIALFGAFWVMQTEELGQGGVRAG